MASTYLNPVRRQERAGRRWRSARWTAAGPAVRAWTRIRCRAERAVTNVRVTADVRASASLEPGERILAFAHNLDGGLVVATERALRHQTTGGWSRLGWEQVARVTWGDDRRTLAVTDVVSGRAAKIGLHAADGTRIADLARERVGSTVLLTELVPLTGHSPVRVTARRHPGTDQILWQVSLGNGSHARNPELRSKVVAAIAELRAHVGV
jgi:hypothetical protein